MQDWSSQQIRYFFFSSNASNWPLPTYTSGLLARQLQSMLGCTHWSQVQMDSMLPCNLGSGKFAFESWGESPFYSSKSHRASACVHSTVTLESRFKEWRPHLPNPTKRQLVRQCHPKRFTFVTFFRTPQCLVDNLTSLPNPTVDTLTGNHLFHILWRCQRIRF